jgi:hypothetical protein
MNVKVVTARNVHWHVDDNRTDSVNVRDVRAHRQQDENKQCTQFCHCADGHDEKKRKTLYRVLPSMDSR